MSNVSCYYITCISFFIFLALVIHVCNNNNNNNNYLYSAYTGLF